MGMKKDKLCKLKVEIQSSNLFRYREIAILVDKPKFLEEIKKIRKGVGIDELLPLKSSNWFGASLKWAKQFPQKDKSLMSHAKRLCREFKRPVYMVNDIYEAILFGKVIVSNTPVGVVQKGTIVERPYVAIFPSPYTTTEDLKTALKQVKQIYKGTNPFNFLTSNLQVSDYKNTSFNAIKEHRELYWRNLAGESYTEIA